MTMTALPSRPTARAHSEERSLLYVAPVGEDVTLALRAFQQAGFPYQVVVARGCSEAEEYLYSTGRYFGRNRLIAPLMVVIDLTVADAGGAALLRKLRGDRTLKHVVAVLLTVSPADTARLKRGSEGNDLFAEKPADLEGFLIMARQMKSLLSHHA
jgi:CheY-like chemotaxis protein